MKTIYLNLNQVLQLQNDTISEEGGSHGIRELAGIESAITQPQTVFFGQELYPSLAEKAAILGFTIISNHPFIDGNKRAGHAAMAAFLFLNEHFINADIDEQETVILQVAAGEMNKETFTEWVKSKITPFKK